MKKSIVLLIPDGIGVKNFIVGSIFRELCNKYKVHVFHSIPENLVKTYFNDANNDVVEHKLLKENNSFFLRTIEYVLYYTHVYIFKTKSMRMLLTIPIRGGIRLKIYVRFCRLIGRALAFKKTAALLRALAERIRLHGEETKGYRKIFQEINPSMLFCSHQRPTSIISPTIAAREEGIPSSCFIFSWDNLSSKGSVAINFDHYLVWSEHMKKELSFYFTANPEHVHIVGTRVPTI